ncbi:MAG: tetratricopeptide repeat protein [Bryobacteraceae bacterium]
MSFLRDILRLPEPPAHYLERTKHATIVPWHERVFGPSPWRGEGRGLLRKSALSLAAICVVGSVATVIYSRGASAKDRQFESGMAALHSGDYTHAQEFLQRTTELDPANAEAFYELGNAYSMLGKAPEAVRAWTEAAKVDPGMGRAYIARGLQSYRENDFAASLKDFEHAVNVEPSMEAYLEQGLALQALGHHQAAISSFDEALRRSNTADSLSIGTARKVSEKALKKAKQSRRR